MFYQKGVDISNTKSMFNFINNHFQYYTMNSWNINKSIANNVKVYRLGLSGDCWAALNFLEADEYETLNFMLRDWEEKNPNYRVGFNGRSSGYLVLYNANNYQSIIPESLIGFDSYEDWKTSIHDYNEYVSDYKTMLIETTKIIQSFDKLCDELRDYTDSLSKQDFKVVAMQNAVDAFNAQYDEDLSFLDFNSVEVDEQGKADISEISKLDCLYEAFYNTVKRYTSGKKISIKGEKLFIID